VIWNVGFKRPEVEYLYLSYSIHSGSRHLAGGQQILFESLGDELEPSWKWPVDVIASKLGSLALGSPDPSTVILLPAVVQI
jgi:hypothetical protein